MAYDLTRKLKEIEAYEPAVPDFKIRLDANESFIDIFKSVPELGERILSEMKDIPVNRYPDSKAMELTAAFADYYNIPLKYITAGNGSDELISLIIGTLLSKGETLLTLSPDFSMYTFYGVLSEVNIYRMPKEENYTVNIQKVIDYCNNNNVKAVIFSNPCNPTSLGIPREDIIKLLKNLFCLVIVDEAYMDFWDQSVLDEVANYDNLIVLKTCSKAFGLAGMRVGFAVAGETITNALRMAKSPYNVDVYSQIAAKNVLMEKNLLRSFTEKIIESRKSLNKMLSELAVDSNLIDKVYESNTNFVFMRTKYADKIYKGLCERSISIKRIGENHLRITAGSYDENTVLMAALMEINEDSQKS
ncbi:MAG: histidinol-phosphate transaminase [Oscillospiraceae bacterium]|nr:histidinol-phosphate transaminase [Oscillospiraceae bacterium]